MAQKKSDILESLISQLEKKQADISCFLDLIDDYMAQPFHRSISPESPLYH